MRIITESQLRKIVREEVGNLRESFSTKPDFHELAMQALEPASFNARVDQIMQALQIAYDAGVTDARTEASEAGMSHNRPPQNRK
jgi:LPS O-antigen subunit length determinant protein (WzzB/FepE family)